MRIALVVIALAASALSAQTPRAAQQEIDHVAAFARLYGVVRYFYPGDAGVTVDWKRFAVHGVARVRRATDTATLETALRELFTPLGPGIEIGRSLSPAPAVGAVDPTLIAWRYTGPGGMSLAAGPYTAGRTNRAAAAAPVNPTVFTAFAQVMPAAPHQGKTIRLRARVRVANPDAGSAGLWLRVDRPNKATGFFDNMQDRPVRSAEWREYQIQGPVAGDAISIVGGLLTNGSVTGEYRRFRARSAQWHDLDPYSDAECRLRGDWEPRGARIMAAHGLRSFAARERRIRRCRRGHALPARHRGSVRSRHYTGGRASRRRRPAQCIQ